LNRASNRITEVDGVLMDPDYFSDRGWSGTDWSICHRCVAEPTLVAHVKRSAVPHEKCTFCGAARAAEGDAFMAVFMAGVWKLFTSADNAGVAWEQGYQLVDPYDGPDLVRDQFGDDFANEDAIEAVAKSILDQPWVARDWAVLSPDERLASDWSAIVELVRGRSRFLSGVTKSKTLHVSRTLKAIGKLIKKYDLVRVLPSGAATWRARIATNAEEARRWDARDLGTPPLRTATAANRMSPVGMPLFYGADDRETAIQETVQRARGGELVAVASYKTSVAAAVVDFSVLPDLPSIYAPGPVGSDYYEIRFLHHFARGLHFPRQGGIADVEYIPTQLATDYFLNHFKADRRIWGIRYRSIHTGVPCVALRVPNERCVALGTPEPPHTGFGPPPLAPELRCLFDRATLALGEITTKVDRVRPITIAQPAPPID
jgi:hypothetical protein